MSPGDAPGLQRDHCLYGAGDHLRRPTVRVLHLLVLRGTQATPVTRAIQTFRRPADGPAPITPVETIPCLILNPTPGARPAASANAVWWPREGRPGCAYDALARPPAKAGAHARLAGRSAASRTGPASSAAGQPASSMSEAHNPARPSTAGPASGPRIVWRVGSVATAASLPTSRTGACAPPAASVPCSATGSDAREPAKRDSSMAADDRRPNGRAPGGVAAGAAKSGSRPRSAFAAGSPRRSRVNRVASPAARSAPLRTAPLMPVARPKDAVRAAVPPRSGPRRYAARAGSSSRDTSRPAMPPRVGGTPIARPGKFVRIAAPPPASGRPAAIPAQSRRTHAPNTSGVCPCTQPNSPLCAPARRSRWACSRTGRTWSCAWRSQDCRSRRWTLSPSKRRCGRR